MWKAQAIMAAVVGMCSDELWGCSRVLRFTFYKKPVCFFFVLCDDYIGYWGFDVKLIGHSWLLMQYTESRDWMIKFAGVLSH